VRVGTGDLDEAEEDRRGDRNPRLVICPGPGGKLHLRGQAWDAVRAVDLAANLLDPARQGVAGSLHDRGP
jgi:hypothetical protein